MLKGISPIISPELLEVLARMDMAMKLCLQMRISPGNLQFKGYPCRRSEDSGIAGGHTAFV
jgi:hypothetical protein